MVEVLGRHLAAAPYPTDVTIVVEREEDKRVFDGWLRRLPQ
jgi:hypothetical protein